MAEGAKPKASLNVPGSKRKEGIERGTDGAAAGHDVKQYGLDGLAPPARRNPQATQVVQVGA